MLNKILNFLYNFDIIGPTPKLFIFNKERYQSIFSLVLSLIIVLVSIVFILYSLINYIQHDRPTVVYSKSNDPNEQRKIYLKDSLLMFQFVDMITLKKLNESIVYFEATYETIFDDATSDYKKLIVKNCNLGENLNSKYETFFREKYSILTYDYEQKDKNFNDFYCVNSENNDISLFYYPNIGYSRIQLNIIIKDKNLFSPENSSIMMIFENNLINHDDKKSPITEGIQHKFIQGFNYNEQTIIDVDFQYFKYETDDGLFFNNLNYLKGMSFFDMTYFKNNIDNSSSTNQNNLTKIGTIILEFNKSNYDYYRRAYKKLQALLAEIMSIVSLLFQIGRLIMEFLNQKKMSVDIIRKLFNIENQNNRSKNFNNYESPRIKIVPEKINNSFKLTEKNGINLTESENNNEETENIKEKVLKSVNVLNVFKSFFCNGDKDKLVSLCHELIIKEMCIDTIIEKFYRLLRIYNSFAEAEKYNLGLNKEPKFRDINSIIYSMIKKNNNG